MQIGAVKKYEAPSFFSKLLLPLLIIWLLLSLLAYFFCCVSSKNAALAAAAEADTIAIVNEAPPSEDMSNEDMLNKDQPNKHIDTHNNTQLAESVDKLAPLPASAAMFMVTFLGDGADMPAFEHSGSFNFPYDDFIHTVPLSEGLQHNLMLLREHLTQHPKQRLTVFGKYLTAEKNRTMFPNLGLARANDIKTYLVNKGFNPKQINMQARLDDKASLKQNDILYAMADFEVNELSEDLLIQEKNELALMKKRITTAPLVLMFQVGEAEIAMSDKQRKQMLNIVNYVSKAKNAKVKVTGHTDSRGTEEANLMLGKDRAAFAKKFLMDNGMDGAVISVYSRGETMPIASNATDEGMAKNRRTVVTVE